MFAGLMDDVLDEHDNDNRQRRLARLFRKRQYFEEQTEWLMQHIGHHLEAPTQRSQPLSVQDKTLITLRYFASGSLYSVLADSNGPSPASVNRAIVGDTKAINATMFQELIRFPLNMDALRLAFFQVNPGNGMPMVCGCVDGTLINIIAPSQDEFQYVDRKNDHSINAMFVCGPNLRFFAASVRWPGSVHDARVFRNSQIGRRLANGWRPFGDAVLLGDSGYGATDYSLLEADLSFSVTQDTGMSTVSATSTTTQLDFRATDYLLTPIANPQCAAERRYNAAHKKTRRVIECAYGVFKNSFLCLKRLRHKDPVFCCEVVKACAVIHNLRTLENYVGTLEETLNNLGLEMEFEEEDDDADNGPGVGDEDDDDEQVPQTQAAARASAQRRLGVMIDTFRR